ncbi:uncharacterized protein LOC131597081 [Vicia villosa]|uniref:uncharacterized protein LOC131597081 n=1 Tax=Vicia villosa TaxID=3911 RepID=UPI00273A77DA|nr:uncharacterized protein LOC131597081 [Vicia villosa]
MELIDDVKARFATMRERCWNSLFADVQELCVARGIPVLNMDDEIPVRGCSRVEGRTITNLHHYRVDIFYVAIEKICVEMDHCFSEGSNIILDCFSCLDPKNSFSKFDVDKLARLADIYNTDFSNDDRGTIRDQLDTYVLQMVQTKKYLVFPLVYKLIELALILLVSIASWEIFKSLDDIDIIQTFTAKKVSERTFAS